MEYGIWLVAGIVIGMLLAYRLYAYEQRVLLACLRLIYEYASEHERFHRYRAEVDPAAATFNILQWMKRVAPR